MRAWRARLLALAVAATLLVPASALAQVVYLCKMSGSVGPRCCCSKAHADREAAPCEPAADRPDCCEARVQAARDATLSNAERAPSVGPALLASTLTMAELTGLAEAAELRARPRARGPPSVGPPVYIQNCTLLR